jgi:tRNA modification GTPase
LRAAREQLEGTLGKRTIEARVAVLGVLAHVEAYIDFPDEDIDPQTGRGLCDRLAAVNTTIDRLLATADQGRVLREGVRTVIFGEPNVGKSSLLNRLLGYERAIVSEVAGTTRDTIEETVNLDGIPLRLIDTAGVREATDRIEAEGIRRTERQIEAADLLIEVHDAGKPRPAAPPRELPASVHRLVVLNKADLGEHPDWAGVEGVRMSCVTGEGFDRLATAIRESLHFGMAEWGDHAVAINARHQDCLARARRAIDTALPLLEPPADPELAAVDLRDALDALGDITGRVDTEDLLGVIFSTFCIGK